MSWQCKAFDALTPAELYAAMELRQRVFIVEQNCAYLDADGADRDARHLLGWQDADESRKLIAYARLLAPRAKFAEASIGRVVTHPEERRTGVGRELMTEAIRNIEKEGWKGGIRIAAQIYLEEFYAGFGFHRVSEPYTEDDIMHVDMLRA